MKRSPVPVVIDHMGRIDASRGTQSAEFQALLALLQAKHVWVKVSGAERISRDS
ncbi:MAG: amidohydrolase, partial [Betaproteobacteria bacterium]